MIGNLLTDYLVQIPDCIPHDLCDDIVNHYRNSDQWREGKVGRGSDVRTETRSCSQLKLSGELDLRLYGCVSNALNSYVERHPDLHVFGDTGYTLLRYEEGDHYDTHVDVGEQTKERVLSASFWLNDDYVGGEMCFPTAGFSNRCSKGSALLFPSNFLFPHKVMPIVSGTRYSVVTWFT